MTTTTTTTPKDDDHHETNKNTPTHTNARLQHSGRFLKLALYQDSYHEPTDYDDEHNNNKSHHEATSRRDPHPQSPHCSTTARRTGCPPRAPLNQWRAGPCLWQKTIYLPPQVHSASVSTQLDTTHAIQPWTAETPHLYTLVLSLHSAIRMPQSSPLGTNDNGNQDDNDNDSGSNRLVPGPTVQAESCRVGFRTISIHHHDGGKLCLNHKPITLCGVHWNDTNTTDKVCSMIRDIRLLKQYNFNAVRITRQDDFPSNNASAAFYRICDAYGLYVWNELTLDVDPKTTTHRHGRNSIWPQWWWQQAGRQYDLADATTMVSRSISRLVQKDYNHPSVIVWSLGNNKHHITHDLDASPLSWWNFVSQPSFMSTRERNFRQARRVIEQLDNSRPICYNGKCPHNHTHST